MERIAFLSLCLMPLCKLFVCVWVCLHVWVCRPPVTDRGSQRLVCGLTSTFPWNVALRRGYICTSYLFTFLWLTSSSHNLRKFLSFCHLVLLSHGVYCSQRHPSAVKQGMTWVRIWPQLGQNEEERFWYLPLGRFMPYFFGKRVNLKWK